jgi:hypothetical protein
MTCDDARRLAARDRIPLEDEIALARHLGSCLECARREERDALLADPVVGAAAAAGRSRRRIRAAASAVVAASLVVAFAFALRARRPEPVTVYVIRGDATGVVLTGPGVLRRSETVSPPQRAVRKGDRT